MWSILYGGVDQANELHHRSNHEFSYQHCLQYLLITVISITANNIGFHTGRETDIAKADNTSLSAV